MQLLLFQENTLGFLTIDFFSVTWQYDKKIILSLLLIYHSWLYFSELLFHGVSGSRKFLPALSSTLTGFSCFLLPGLLFFVLLLLYHRCYGFERAFFTLRCFLPYPFFQYLTHAYLIHGPEVLPWRLQDYPLWFKTQIRSFCLFESISFPQTFNQLRTFFKVVKICS